MKLKTVIFLICLMISFNIFAQKKYETKGAPKETNKERLDNSFGFREFKLQSSKSNFVHYELRRTDYYKMPEIIEVYTLDYKIPIGNTRINYLHLFFLGDRLVRVTAILNDSLSLDYLKKSFGEGSKPEETTVKLDEKLFDDIGKGIVRFAYKPIWTWKADTVRFEEKWIYLCDEGSCVQRMCLDLYLKDFQDLMRSIYDY